PCIPLTPFKRFLSDAVTVAFSICTALKQSVYTFVKPPFADFKRHYPKKLYRKLLSYEAFF
ncbi:MAG: hypothetical protein IJP33_04060, partial [Firmicutes bacterium]|nr:hypothetical protein [Bacillota bacterium]